MGETEATRPPSTDARPGGVARPGEAPPLTLARADAPPARPWLAGQPPRSPSDERRAAPGSSQDGRWYGSSAGP
ncbi:hypothetical protein ACFQ3X_42600, partial [Plantactinospora endophytica]